MRNDERALTNVVFPNGDAEQLSQRVYEHDPHKETGAFLVDTFVSIGRAERYAGEDFENNLPIDAHTETIVEWLGGRSVKVKLLEEITKLLHPLSKNSPGSFADALFGMVRAATWQSYESPNHKSGSAVQEIFRNFLPQSPFEKYILEAAKISFTKKTDSIRNPFHKDVPADDYENLYFGYGEALRRQINIKSRLLPSENIFPMATDAAYITNRAELPTEFVPLDLAWKEIPVQSVRLDSVQSIRELMYRVPSSYTDSITTHAVDAINMYIGEVVLSEKLGEKYLEQTSRNHLDTLIEKFPEIDEKTWKVLMAHNEASHIDELLFGEQVSKQKTKNGIAKEFLRNFFQSGLVNKFPDYEIDLIRIDLQHKNIRSAFWRLGKLLSESASFVGEEEKEVYIWVDAYEKTADVIDTTPQVDAVDVPDFKPQKSPLTEALATIDGHWPEISERIKKDLDRIETTMLAEMPGTNRASFDTVFKSKEIAYFGNTVTPDDIACVQQFQRLSVRLAVEKDLNFNLGNISLRSQVHLIKFLSRASLKEYKNLLKVMHGIVPQSRENFLSVFLSGAEDSSLPKMAVTLAESLAPEVTAKIFNKYAELVRQVEGIEIYIEKLATNKGVGQGAEIQATGLLIKKANTLLKKISSGSEIFSAIEIEDILEQYTADGALFSASVRSLGDHGFDVTTLRETSLARVSSQELRQNADDCKKIISLITDSYKGQPEMFRNAVLESFSNALNNADTNFYILRRNETPVAALRFDTLKNSSGSVIKKYFGSFVSDSNYGNGKLGEAVYDKAIKAEVSKGVPIEANSNPLSPISQKYIETGFVATKLEDYAGVPSFSIRLDSKINEKSDTKKWTIEQIISAALAQDTGNIKTYSVRSTNEIPFELVNKGFLLTRYLKQGSRIYAVFEALSIEEDLSEAVEKGTA